MKVTLQLATADTALPDGTTFGGQYRYVVTGGDSPVTQDSPALSVDFDLAPGSYVGTAQALDTTGQSFGPSVSAVFTVPTAATFPAPSSLTVSLG